MANGTPTSPGLAGWTIRLEGEGWSTTLSAVTDEFGRYWFMNLTRRRLYHHRSAYSRLGADLAAGRLLQFAVRPQPEYRRLNFGNRPEPVGGIHGAKWLDENGNGQWDPNEPGLAGWTIRLEGEEGTRTLSAVTDEFGRYWFMDLPGGVYTITEHLLNGWEQTWPPAGYYSCSSTPARVSTG